jgi:hypothetical protein
LRNRLESFSQTDSTNGVPLGLWVMMAGIRGIRMEGIFNNIQARLSPDDSKRLWSRKDRFLIPRQRASRIRKQSGKETDVNVPCWDIGVLRKECPFQQSPFTNVKDAVVKLGFRSVYPLARHCFEKRCDTALNRGSPGHRSHTFLSTPNGCPDNTPDSS